MPSKPYTERKNARLAAAAKLAAVVQKGVSSEDDVEALRALAHFFYLAVKPAQLEELIALHPVLLPDDDLPLTEWINKVLLPAERQVDFFESLIKAQSA